MADLRTVTVETAPPYPVRVGPGAYTASADLLGGAAVLISDRRVHELHGSGLAASDLPLHLLPAGETAKTLKELEQVLDFLCEERVDRSATLLVQGGGAATDLGGLAAALYLRGVSWIACPTTLLAMVDASVGGKTALNLKSGKNLAGSFHQPAAVVADTDTLSTLTAPEYSSGLGEVLKTALVEGEDLLAFIEANAAALVERDADVLADVVCRCVTTKARVVASDPHEDGPRKALNLGHTFAHAIEQVAEPGTIPHGVAVAVGCALALEAAAGADILVDPALSDRVSALASALGLPTTLSSLRETSGHPLPAGELVAAMSHDKKASAGTPRFVLPRRAGDLELDVVIDPTPLLA